MPFITEELWHRLGQTTSIAIAAYPRPSSVDEGAEREMALLQEMITAARTLRADRKLGQKESLPGVLYCHDGAQTVAQHYRDVLEKLANVNLDIRAEAPPKLEGAVRSTPEFDLWLETPQADSDAQRELADLYASAGKNDLAENTYRALVTAQPKDPELHRGLGQALLRQKKFPEAQQEFLTALQLKRDSPDVYVDLAFAASENKNYELTIRALNGRTLLNAELPAICFFLRASAYDHLRDYKLAAVDYHHFLEVANGKYPDQEWQATHRLIAIEPKKR